MKKGLWLALGTTIAMLAGGVATAGNDGFFTTYNSEVERGEIELMLMSDFTRPSRVKHGEGQGDYFSHMFELEYGVTDQLATEVMIESYEDLAHHQATFTGYRLESRYRLFKDRFPLNPMVYVEYEDLSPDTRYKMEVSGWVQPPYKEAGESGRERIMETRLVLSETFGNFDFAWNWINETSVTNSATSFGYAFGVMWHHHAAALEAGDAAHGEHCSLSSSCNCSHTMKNCGCAHCTGHSDRCTCAHAGGYSAGLEMFGMLGDGRRFGITAWRQEHYLAPTLMYHLTSRMMLEAQVAFGLTRSSDNLVRLNLGYEF